MTGPDDRSKPLTAHRAQPPKLAMLVRSRSPTSHVVAGRWLVLGRLSVDHRGPGDGDLVKARRDGYQPEGRGAKARSHTLRRPWGLARLHPGCEITTERLAPEARTGKMISWAVKLPGGHWPSDAGEQ